MRLYLQVDDLLGDIMHLDEIEPKHTLHTLSEKDLCNKVITVTKVVSNSS